MPDGQVDLFYSYSHKDEELREQLDGHLALLRRRGVLRVWHDRMISAGDEWRNEIDAELERADVVLLLISADFLASDYCYDVEMKRALERDAAKQARVIPVIVRACDGLDDAPFAHLQALPKDRRPVTSWPNRDEAWVDVVKGIRLSVGQLPATPADAEVPIAPQADDRKRPAPEPQPQDAGGDVPVMPDSMRGSLVMRILRKLGSGLAKGVVVGGPDMDAAEESHPVPPPAGSRPGMQRPRPGTPPRATRGAAADTARDQREAELMQRVIADFSGRVQAAYAGRNAGAQFAPAAAAAAAEALAGIREQKRILWVDDAPAGNAQEVNALLGLQIEVQQVSSTQAALDALAAASPPFDLVISDWNRVPRVEPLTPEGIRLLRLMRRAGWTTPLVYYHGEFDEKRARGRAQQARREGAFGAASLPAELFALVRDALGDRAGPAP